MEENKKKDKILFANVLKIIASFAVVMLHIASLKWGDENVSIKNWSIMNFYDSLCKFCIPIFIMVTGMLFLSKEKEIPVKIIFTKYIKRVAILFIVWSSIYYILFNINKGSNIKQIFAGIIDGYYHLWYLYMLIGLYLIMPILKKLINTAEKREIEYFLIFWFVWQCVLGTIIKFDQLAFLKNVYSKFKIELVLGYSGYLVLGYYLNTYSLNKIKRISSYLLGMMGVSIVILGTYYLKVKNIQGVDDIFYNYLAFPNCFASIAIFVGVKQYCNNKKLSHNFEDIIHKITKLTLGVYLIHPLVIRVILKLFPNLFNNWLFIMIPSVAVFVYIITFIISYILNTIPKIGKYIV